MDTTPLAEFLARPGQSMESHVQGVAGASADLTTGAGTNPYGDRWADVVETLAWIHDIGKLTQFFQDYIRTEDRTAAPAVELTYHGTFGGLVAVLALGERGFQPETAAAGFYAVTKHHSVLSNVRTELPEFHQLNRSRIENRYDIADRQLQSIDDTAADAAAVLLAQATDGKYTWESLANDGIRRAAGVIKQVERTTHDPAFYGCVLRAWSTLVAADKADASGLAADDSLSVRTGTDISSDTLTGEIESLADTTLPDGSTAAAYLEEPTRPLPGSDATTTQRLAALRTAANARAATALESGHQRGDRVFELTLPTGFGKTYTGLRAALQVADKRESRVIYALPYTSIIDQVDANIRDIFDVAPTDPTYTKHHHLADTRSTLDPSAVDEPSSGRETLHAEAWRSQLVLTTFTQLFESVAGPGNVQSTKLPALQNSVIIVDEPQALPHEWWELLGRLTEYLTTEYDATILFMTATQPRVLESLPSAPTPQSLVDLHGECAAVIANEPRVTFELHDSLIAHLDERDAPPLSLTDAAAELEPELVGARNTLTVVNTVSSAVTMTEALSEVDRLHLGSELLPYLQAPGTESPSAEDYLAHLAEEQSDPEGVILTLTTRLRPADRRLLLDAVSRVLDPDTTTPFDDVPTMTVSTQLIEAGVDVSFDRLYRDFAPLPSLVQAAGRCNREFGDPPAPVTVWRLDSPEDDDYVPSRLIYGDDSLLRPTQRALSALRTEQADTTLSEAAVITDGVMTYYDALHDQRRTGDRTDRLVEAFDKARGQTLREASLIDSEYATADYLVLVSDCDKRLHAEYVEYRETGAWRQAQQAFRRLQETLVSVPVDEAGVDEPSVIEVDCDGSGYDVRFGSGVTASEVRTDTEV